MWGSLRLLVLLLLPTVGDDAVSRVPASKQAVEAPAPAVPDSVVASLQAGRYAEAADALAKLADGAKTPEDRAYFNLIRGIALRLDQKLDTARTVLSAALKQAETGPWAAKLKSELVAVELAARHYAAAETVARAEAERLLAGTRKDRLAAVYEQFAQRLLNPSEPATPADPEGAYVLLSQARELAKSDATRARLLLAMGRASMKAGNPGRAIENFQTYLNQHKEGADTTEVRYLLGEAQLAAGQPLPARLTWTDLARDLEKADTKAAQETRGRALFQISRTHGFPTPGDDASLNLGIAVLKRFLEAYPGHPLAVQAAYELGTAQASRAKSDAAIAALRAFVRGEGFEPATEEAKRNFAQLRMAAQFQIGQLFQGQEKFDQAIAAWTEYLAKYPNGPQSADAQRALVDVQLLIAQDHLRKKAHEQARTSWQNFVTQNPLDPRVPQVLFQIGESFVTEEKFDQAIAAWDVLAGKFPGTEPAAHGQFLIASIYEQQKGQLSEAIDRFKQVSVDPWATAARQRIAVMEAKALAVITPRAFRSGETAKLKISSRNIEKLTFTAYRLDAEAYFRKKSSTGGVEALDIGLVQPDAEWTADVPGYDKYKPIEKEYELPKLELPGVYVVKVSDEKTLQATSLVLGSDVDAIVKVSRDQLLVYAQDMKTGKGRPNARVLVSDGQKILFEGKTGDDGVLLSKWTEPASTALLPPRDNDAPPVPCGATAMAEHEVDERTVQLPPGANLTYLILDGAHVAGSGLGIPGNVAQGLSPRAYLYTDRPAYRPGQLVELRGVVREVDDGQYANRAGAKYKLEVYDSRGRQFVAREVLLSEFGTFAAHINLDGSAPVGAYRVRLFQPGKSDFAGTFEVQAYALQKVDVTIDLPRTVYFRGEIIEGTVTARYQYGTPLAGRELELALPDGRTLRVQTDDAGQYKFKVATEGFAEEQALSLVARLPQDNVAVAVAVQLAIRAFRIDLSTARGLYLDGESFPLTVKTIDALGKPTGQKLSVAVIKRLTQADRLVEREVSKQDVTTDDKTGEARVPVRVDDLEGGTYIVRAAGTDRFGNPIVTDHLLTISGEKDEQKLRILADRVVYKVGEEAQVNLHSRLDKATALLTWEADRILRYKLVELKKGDNPLKWEVKADEFPNFSLGAAAMSDTHFHRQALDLRIERDLRVTLKPKKESVGPGEEVEVEVTTTDQRGRPVSAELSLALVDRALLRLYGDRLPSIAAFFYDQTRTGAFSTESTNTFRYAPATVPVPEAVVEEEEMQAALAAAEVDRAKDQVAFFADGASRPQGAPAAPAMAGGMGGMGGGGAQMMGQSAYGAAYNYSADDMRRKLASGAISARDAEKMEDLARKRAELGMGVEEPANREWAAQAGELGDQLKAGKPVQLSLNSARRSGMARGGRMFAEKAKADLADFDNSSPREQFVETAYWNPSVKTDANGKSTVTFKAPTALSEYQFTARGVTGAETLVGQATAELAVRKPFFVDIRLPSTLTEGDKPRFMAELHHKGVNGKVELTLTVYAAGREERYPRTLELKGDGVERVLFEPFEVPVGDEVRVAIEAKSANANDALQAAIPIRPWGVQALATASGSAHDDETVFVGLPDGKYEAPEMLITIAPGLKRMIIELALGRDYYVFDPRVERCILPPMPNTTADRASDLLATAAALSYLRNSGGTAAPEAKRLAERISGGVSELITLQNDDGGWPWVPPTQPGQALPSNRHSSTLALWALAEAEKLGLATDTTLLDKAAGYLTAEFAKIDAADIDTRAAVLHALSTRGKASFELANGLNRQRQALSDGGLASLALAFAELNRPELAREVLSILTPRAQQEVPTPGGQVLYYWKGAGRNPWMNTPTETTALAALAYARVAPQEQVLAGSVAWMLAHRTAFGWQPPKAKGPALAALGLFYGGAQQQSDRYRLTISVNDKELETLDVQGAPEGKAIRVPLKDIDPSKRNRVHFDLEGRGAFAYAVTLTGFRRDFGPDQDANGKLFGINRRVYWAPQPLLDGKVVGTGFSVAVNPQTFENTIKHLELGASTTISVEAWRNNPAGQPEWERPMLVLEEHLPAGTSLVEGSVNSQASYYEYGDGVLRLYFAPDQWPGCTYQVHGALSGSYRALPPVLSSAYEPGKRHIGQPADLVVLNPGQKSDDPYKPTPDELYNRGKMLYDAGRLADASAPLESLWDSYSLRDDIAKDAARMLLTINIKGYDPRKIVKYFEILKEKSPELVIPFDQIAIVGRAYADIGEHERAYLVWRATAEASYLEDAQVGEVLRQRGKTLEGVALLLELWRDYPSTSSIQNDLFGISSVLGNLAGRAINDVNLRRELAKAEVSRTDLLAQQIRLIVMFLSQSPAEPVADEASLALLGSFLELEDYKRVVALAERYAGLYPKSKFIDSFLYSEALGHFHLGQYDPAIKLAERIATATYKDASGADIPSPNKWQALYILGQIYDARHVPAKAVDYYQQVADRFGDAQSAVRELLRKELKLPEVAVVRPAKVDVQAAGVGLRNVGLAPQDVKKKAELELDYRNLSEVDVKVYAVDLMRLYLTRRNLDSITGIDLAGIKPLLEKTVNLGDGHDYDDKKKELDLPLEKEGAYLVMARGENLYSSGIVLVSPIELEVLEEPESGRVRVRVRDARSGDYLPKVQVKVIGSNNGKFFSGETDLRGIFVAEGVNGTVTAVARKDANQYAFYRGKQFVGAPPVPATTNAPAQAPGQPPGAGKPGSQGQSLEENLKMLNESNSMRQLERLQQRYQATPSDSKGVQVDKAR